MEGCRCRCRWAPRLLLLLSSPCTVHTCLGTLGAESTLYLPGTAIQWCTLHVIPLALQYSLDYPPDTIDPEPRHMRPGQFDFAVVAALLRCGNAKVKEEEGKSKSDTPSLVLPVSAYAITAENPSWPAPNASHSNLRLLRGPQLPSFIINADGS